MFNVVNYFSYVFVVGITPGPVNLTTLSNAVRLGIKKAFPFNLGAALGFLIVDITCSIFSNFLMKVLPVIKFPMLVVGALYMIFLAYKIFISSFKIEFGKNHSAKAIDAEKNLFVSGILIQLVNAKVYLSVIVALEAYILPVYQGNYFMLILIAFCQVFISFLCAMCWLLFGSVFNALFSKYAKITNTIMALLLVYCAISLFF